MENQYMSLLKQIQLGYKIDTSVGTWGGGGSAVWWPLMDLAVLAANTNSYPLFNTGFDTAPKTPQITNMPGTTVPDGERWDLYGMSWYVMPAAGAVFTEALFAALRSFILNSNYVISLNQTIIRNVPLWKHFGNMGAQNEAITPTLALQTPMPSTNWHEQWPEDLYLPLQGKTKMTFSIQCNAAAVTAGGTLAGCGIGVEFDRIVVGAVS